MATTAATRWNSWGTTALVVTADVLLGVVAAAKPDEELEQSAHVVTERATRFLHCSGLLRKRSATIVGCHSCDPLEQLGHDSPGGDR